MFFYQLYDTIKKKYIVVWKNINDLGNFEKNDLGKKYSHQFWPFDTIHVRKIFSVSSQFEKILPHWNRPPCIYVWNSWKSRVRKHQNKKRVSFEHEETKSHTLRHCIGVKTRLTLVGNRLTRRDSETRWSRILLFTAVSGRIHAVSAFKEAAICLRFALFTHW